MTGKVEEIIAAIETIGNTIGEITEEEMQIALELKKNPLHYTELRKTANGYAFDSLDSFTIHYTKVAGGFIYYLSWGDDEWENEVPMSLKKCQRSVGLIIQDRFKVQKQDTGKPTAPQTIKPTTKTNTCPLCGYDAEMTEEAHRYIFEVWQCQDCRLKFSEVGTGIEWVPAEFLDGKTYSAKIWNGKETIDLELEVIEKKEAHITCRVNGVFQHEFEFSVGNEVEVIHVGADLVGMPGTVFPYDVVFDEPCCDSPERQKCMQCQDTQPNY